MAEKAGGYDPAHATATTNGGIGAGNPDALNQLVQLLLENLKRSSTNGTTELSEEVRRALAFVAAALDSINAALDLRDNPISITSIQPSEGRAGVNESVIIRGSHFLPGSIVLFGPEAAREVDVLSVDTLRATTPARSAGKVEVVVNTLAGSARKSDGYTYK